MTKQVTVYLSRKITLNRHEKEPLSLASGRNVVDEDVAAHPFIRAHFIEAIDATPDEVAALRVRVAELEAELAALKASKPGRKAKSDSDTEAGE